MFNKSLHCWSVEQTTRDAFVSKNLCYVQASILSISNTSLFLTIKAMPFVQFSFSVSYSSSKISSTILYAAFLRSSACASVKLNFLKHSCVCSTDNIKSLSQATRLVVKRYLIAQDRLA